ncbi:MAG: ATPase [Prevotellaceae bacterium]|jgi:N-acetylglucosamine kinase-like BadF-type ATPase|nr:ATPase [Prevotellaceae bacterium]
MTLIADSGSTKTHWNCAGKDFFTQGINPFFISEDEIISLILTELSGEIALGSVTELFFYGAGCTPENCEVLSKTLSVSFPNAAVIQVKSDVLGAARALFQHSAGIACILGTGSNSCFYNGDENVDSVPSLGYVLGDEGSGAALGKRLLGDCLKKLMTENIVEKFSEKYEITTAEILENIYKKPFPNRYMARFCEFLYENQNEPEIDALILNEFQAFFDRNIIKYDFKKYPVNFVGSVAAMFERQLRQVSDYNDFRIGKILRQPMSGLVTFHSS